MKIEIDSTYCIIYDPKTDTVLINLFKDYNAFQKLISKILNVTQQKRLEVTDGIFTLSNKAYEILMEEVIKYNIER